MRRFTDMEYDSLHFPSADEYLRYKLPTLEQAVASIIPRNNHLNQLIEIAKAKCHFPSKHNLTLDESAAIYLYTMEWNDTSLYDVIEKDLCSTDRSTSQSWFLYLKLFNTAVKKLPDCRMNVWRGINEDLCKKLKKDDQFIWRCFTSCSSDDGFIQECLDINFTLCMIETIHAKDISIYSSCPNQHEIILCPDTRLQVLSYVKTPISSSKLHLRENIHHKSSSSSSIVKNNNNETVKMVLLTWYNHRILSLLPHLILLIMAFLIAIFSSKIRITLETSDINTILTSTVYQPLQMIFPSKNKLSQSSNIQIHIDTMGNKYEGELIDGKKHGKGKMEFANGHTYTGEWVDDMATGEGVFVWNNGDQYKGQLKYGQRHGKGSYYFVNGDTYIGDWIEDKKDGYGTASLGLGKYEGEFKNDKMHGKGAFYFTNGDTYLGSWIDDKQEGEGIFSWANGDKYEGDFKAGKLHGKGSYFFGNGNKFTGDWIDGERQSDHGAFTWAKVGPHPARHKEQEKLEES